MIKQNCPLSFFLFFNFITQICFLLEGRCSLRTPRHIKRRKAAAPPCTQPAPTASSPPQTFWLRVSTLASSSFSPLLLTLQTPARAIPAVTWFCKEYSGCFETQVQLLPHHREPHLSGGKLSISPMLLPQRCLSIKKNTRAWQSSPAPSSAAH